MKKLIKVGIILFVINKLSSVLSVFTMYGGVYFFSAYNPSLKEKLNEHHVQVLQIVEEFLMNLVAAINFQDVVKYVLVALVILSFFIGIKMFIREVRHYGHPKRA